MTSIKKIVAKAANSLRAVCCVIKAFNFFNNLPLYIKTFPFKYLTHYSRALYSMREFTLNYEIKNKRRQYHKKTASLDPYLYKLLIA